MRNPLIFILTVLLLGFGISGIIISSSLYASKPLAKSKPLSICEAMADTNYVVLTLAEYKKMDSVVSITLNK